jgi:uncharacterized protein with ParB-like and HNH nuclease domain
MSAPPIPDLLPGDRWPISAGLSYLPSVPGSVAVGIKGVELGEEPRVVAARETTLQELLEGSKQYQVPLYQRTYSWKQDQLRRLWEDILKLAEDRVDSPGATHFIGSLVLAPSPSNGPAGVSEFLVVDGQQRLTTLSILLCAIRDHLVKTEDPEHRERIDQQYLINKWKPEQQRLKLVPTQEDRPAYPSSRSS